MLRERAKGKVPAAALLLAVLLAAVTATAGAVLAARPSDTSGQASRGGPAPAAPRTVDAYAHFAPAGPLTVLVGSRFTLDLMVNSGSNAVTVAQSYVTFTQSLLQNVDPGMPGCVLTDTVTQDPTSFGTELQNEVCNDSEPCDFGRIIDPPGSIAFASGRAPALPAVSGDFRVAQITFCAVATGDADIRWEFTGDRESFIEDAGANRVSNPALYTNYVVHIVTPTDTPTNTATPTDTPTFTNTPTHTHTATFTSTSTRTSTPTSTPFVANAYAHLAPAGPLTVVAGDKINLDLLINTGTNNAIAAQNYLTFTQSLLQNVDVNGGGCIVTDTVTQDVSVFGLELQNQVCNDSEPCTFGFGTVPPGSIAFASAADVGQPNAAGDFRVAQIAFCATAPGDAHVHWQFAGERDSYIMDSNINRVSNPALYSDLIIHIVAPTSTPTHTATHTHTATSTPSNTPTHTPTDTHTATPTHTPTDTHTATPTHTASSTATVTATATDSPTATETLTHTPTNTPTDTYTATVTETHTPTNTVTETETHTPSSTPTDTPTHTPTNTYSATVTVTETSTHTHTPTHTPSNTVTVTPTHTPSNTPTRTATVTNTAVVPSAFAHLAPGGPLTVVVGDRINFDLLLTTGINNAFAAQSYMTFTQSLLQNVATDTPGCTLTDTITPDTARFNEVLQNQVCNDSEPCTFDLGTVPPGSIAFASGVGPADPAQQGTFRVATVALCASAPGDAVIHWQFSGNRDSLIMDNNLNIVSNPALYTDVVVHILAPTGTPTHTATATHTPTATHTFTPTVTGTPTLTHTETPSPTVTHTHTPTVTLTPSATPTVPGVLVGHVIWQSRPNQPDPLQQLPVTLTLKVGITLEVNYPVQTTDASGNFTVTTTGLPYDTYSWRVKGPRFLASSGSVVLNGAPITGVEMGLQRVGDADDNNIVSASDFNILKLAFGTSFGQSGYDDRADFDGDQIVNAADFNWLRQNFGTPGSPPLAPGGAK